jgi:truncated hemoglobin YjbI
MSDTQRNAINKEHFETWMRCMEELQNMYGKVNSGTIL